MSVISAAGNIARTTIIGRLDKSFTWLQPVPFTLTKRTLMKDEEVGGITTAIVAKL